MSFLEVLEVKGTLISFNFGGYGWIHRSSNKLWESMNYIQCFLWKGYLSGKHLHQALSLSLERLKIKLTMPLN